MRVMASSRSQLCEYEHMLAYLSPPRLFNSNTSSTFGQFVPLLIHTNMERSSSFRDNERFSAAGNPILKCAATTMWAAEHGVKTMVSLSVET